MSDFPGEGPSWAWLLLEGLFSSHGPAMPEPPPAQWRACGIVAVDSLVGIFAVSISRIPAPSYSMPATYASLASVPALPALAFGVVAGKSKKQSLI
ncbi:hypothetical protein TUM18999_41040 [Pseudomonas tohonis]|uniref:Uncharacterized protein n=1 Tax=Pseudomonas tohonis TaxID=2725477 RepID=A0A6J4E7H8_9PSED|nr:hypothetical protein [Pseudomonas tohonis]BCG25913.1 hypothetical protein TUM18999_41040 [Pseudomonas tohonis]GJN55584.1 hypothetical protein TUM20286_53360 [Pseudomonas tohonis]